MSVLTLIGSDGQVWDLDAGPVVAATTQRIWGAPPGRVQIEAYTGRAGGVITEALHDIRPVPLRLRVDGRDFDTIRATLAQFAASVSIRNGQCRIVNQRSGREIAAIYRSGLDPEIVDIQKRRTVPFDVVFDAPEPYWTAIEPETTRFTTEVTPTEIITLAWSTPVPWYLQMPWDGTFEQQPGQQRRTINVTGDVPAWPIWVINGPIDDFEVSGNGAVLAYDGALTAGQVLIIETRPERATLDGVNVYGTIRRGLGNGMFPLRDGPNQLAIQVNGGVAGQTSVDVEWTPRYESAG